MIAELDDWLEGLAIQRSAVALPIPTLGTGALSILILILVVTALSRIQQQI